MGKKKHLKTLRHGNGTNGRRRANGTGTLEKRPGGWLARWHVRNRQGVMMKVSKLIPKSEEVPDIDAARQKLNELTKENSFFNAEQALLRLQNQLLGIRKDREAYRESLPAMKLDDAFEVFSCTRAGSRCCAATRTQYELQWSKFCRWMKDTHPGETEMRQITRPIAREWSEYLLKTISGSTHNRYITLFSAIWDAIIKKEDEESDGLSKNANMSLINSQNKARLTINPWKCIEKADVIVHSRRDLTLNEIHRLSSHAEGQWKMLICILLTTGLRLKDAVLLKHESIFLEKGYIKIRPHKVERRMTLKNEWTYIPILPDLYNMLVEIPFITRNGYVVPDLAEKYSDSPTTFNYHLGKIFKAAGLVSDEVGSHGRKVAKICAHHLRHTFASLAARHCDLKTVQTLLSHHSIGMTKNYVHADPEALKLQMASFPRLISDVAAIDASSALPLSASSPIQQEIP